MDKLSMCRAMEAVCTQHALSDELHRERWLNLMDEWNERAHKAAARHFQGRDTTQPIGADTRCNRLTTEADLRLRPEARMTFEDDES